MDTQTFFFAFYELLLSLVFGLLTVFLGMKFTGWTFLKSHGEDPLLGGNTAASIFAGVFIVCLLLLTSASVLPAVDALRTMAAVGGGITFKKVLISFVYFIAFYLLSLLAAMVTVFLTTQIYLRATVNIDEMREIMRNNVAVAVLLGSVLLGMTLFVRVPLQRVVASMVSYESLGKVEVNPQTETRQGEEKYMVPVKAGAGGY
ncbi:MAG: hypothetical protein OEV94_07800 [Deltaproteobacteria bacterium]|nr:hypothetical protein [Deltaproteobacteria bacterium]